MVPIIVRSSLLLLMMMLLMLMMLCCSECDVLNASLSLSCAPSVMCPKELLDCVEYVSRKPQSTNWRKKNRKKEGNEATAQFMIDYVNVLWGGNGDHG
mmetsp:Transcript_29558/g.62280  ORF Transcript_29558/g.62280 Transcript_29558/m.62280 type:complete len:98 (-) Transcript_29558:29-322(-)